MEQKAQGKIPAPPVLVFSAYIVPYRALAPISREDREAIRQIFKLGPHETRKFARVIVEAGEDRLEVDHADVFGEDFAEHGTKVRGECEIPAFVELMIVQAGPLAVDLPATHVSAHHKHAIGMAVVRTVVAVFFCGAAEFAHGDKNDVLHAVAEVLVKRGQSLAEIAQQIRKLALHTAFVEVVVPSAAIDKQNFHADVRLQKLADLLETLAEAAGGILRAVF